MELFHVIADGECAKVRRKIVELGAKDQIDFRNIDASADAKLRLQALCGSLEVPTLWTGDRVIKGANEILTYLETI